MNAMKKLRKAKNLTQAELGERLGVTSSRISQIEAGHGGLKRKHLANLLDTFGGDILALGISFREFLQD